ncbi:hypothetical protein N0V83_000008 [Neocucurbitaria cava]|uniref:Uncharacterized protein n=1 Tax=Neocucurbitaria cava TaxID=798079 RepID=A0A9W8YFJ8_9PLEO|nr:hypothetical protein N0V83_000008 [Neocucurbitaria cava]
MATKYANELPMPAATIPVELNDELRVTVATLSSEPTTVEWTQDWGKRKSDTYYAVTFTNVTKKNDPGRLFVANKSLESLKNNAQLVDGGKVYSFKVTEEFLYGQDNKGQNRFLVLHDPANKVFQHRFASNKRIKIADTVTDTVTGVAKRGKEEMEVVQGLITSKFGDELKKFVARA